MKGSRCPEKGAKFSENSDQPQNFDGGNNDLIQML